MKKQYYKNWWITLILGLLMPGLGHIYNGNLRKGGVIVLSFHGISLGIATFAATSLHTQSTFVLALFTILLLWLIVAFEGVFEVYNKKIPSSQHLVDYWFTPLIFVVIIFFGFTKPLLYLAREHFVHFYFIPSKSMVPTLIVGDQVLVKPFSTSDTIHSYGDIIVFRNAIDSGNYWIKRVAVLPGETVSINALSLTRNGVVIPQAPNQECSDTLILCTLKYDYRVPQKDDHFLIDTLSPSDFLFLYHIIKDERIHQLSYGQLYLYLDDMYTSSLDLDTITNRAQLANIMRKDSVQYSQSKVSYRPVLFLDKQTPESSYTLQHNSYFLIGDNRSNSYDSRLFGPVSEIAFTGKAKAIYLSFNADETFRYNRTGLPLTNEFPHD